MPGDSVAERADALRASFLDRYGNELTALGTVLLVGLLLVLVDRFFRRRAAAIAREMAGGEIDPVVLTRLRFVRRLAAAVIAVLGLATALSQFTPLDRFAASVLASGAIAAAVVGFAAQQSLGNVIAGVLLAITQPIRIGDAVGFEDDTGVVEDIRLTHTFLRTGADARVIVPNGRLAGGILRNDSIVTDTVAVEVELWLDGERDELRALEVLAAQVPGARPKVTAVTHEGTSLAVAADPVAPLERSARQAELLQECLRALRSAGLRG